MNENPYEMPPQPVLPPRLPDEFRRPAAGTGWAAEEPHDPMSLLEEVAEALSHAITPSDVSLAVVDRTAAAFGAAGGVIAVVTDSGTEIELVRASAMPEEIEQGWHRFPIAAPVPLSEAVRTGAPLFIESRDDWEQRYPTVRTLLAETGHHSVLAVPLLVEGRTIGAMGMSFAEPRTFGEIDRRLTVTIARLTAQALERARLYAAERNARSEAELARTRLMAIFAQTPALVAVMRGPEHVFELVNRAYAQLLGERNVIGKPVREALPEAEGQGVFERLDEVYRTGVPFRGNEMTIMLRAPDDGLLEQHFLTFVYQPIFEEDGTISGVLVHGLDMTSEVRARRELERTYEAVREANRIKSEFLTTMSHELRTPLNAITGYVALLDMGIRGPVTREQSLDLARIRVNSEHLLGLINNVLNFARLDAGQVQFTLTDVPVAGALAEMEALIAPQLREKGLIYGQSPIDQDVAARADRDKLRQILLNLLANAIKFTASGGEIHLSADANADTVRISVRDTGRGIAREQLDLVFEPFVQVGRRLSSSHHDGVGLGLAISRDLARRMGGDLTAESVVDQGSTFTLVLPRSRDDA